MHEICQRRDDSMNIDKDPAEDGSEESDADDENNSEEVDTQSLSVFGDHP